MVKDIEGRLAPQLLILPTERSSAARICTLLHPSTSNPCRFFYDPSLGMYEFTAFESSDGHPKSWLLTPPSFSGVTEPLVQSGHVLKRPRMLIATPFDPLFLLLPTLSHAENKKPTQDLFITFEDISERMVERSPQLETVLQQPKLAAAFEGSLRPICDTVDAGDETMYKLSDEKLFQTLLIKAKRFGEKGLPESLEQKYIQGALHMPSLAFECSEESTTTNVNASSGTNVTAEGATDSQSSSSSLSRAPQAIAGIAPSSPIRIDGQILKLEQLLRVKIAFEYIVSAYLPATLKAKLSVLLAAGKSGLDCNELDARMAEVSKRRGEIEKQRSGDDFCLKRTAGAEEDILDMSRAAKKKKEDGKKKKAGPKTRGQNQLKTSDAAGCAKLTSLSFIRMSSNKTGTADTKK